MPLWIARIFWWFRKKFDKLKPLTVSDSNELINYYENAMRTFKSLGIDIQSKPIEQRRLYTMMLVYLDREEAICPAGARTAMLIGMLESLDTGWILPPASQAVSLEFSKEIDGYVSLEIFRNNLGISDIRDEIRNAINSFNA